MVVKHEQWLRESAFEMARKRSHIRDVVSSHLVREVYHRNKQSLSSDLNKIR